LSTQQNRDLFLRLTPDWVLSAVEAGGYEPTGHVLALNSLENRVYDLMLEDSSHVVAKFYRPERWSKEAILEEHAFLQELLDTEIPVAAPVAFSDGETLHEVEGIFYAIWKRVGGRAPHEISDEEAEILGRLLARMHNVGAAGRAPHRRKLDSKTFVHEPLETIKKLIPPQWAGRYEKAALEVAAIYEQRSRGVPTHRIHGDCHPGNLLRKDPPPPKPGSPALKAEFFFLDFDDFVTGPAVQDVWMLVPSRDEEGARQRDVLISGYQQFREFDPRWLRLVEPLRALRFIHYAAWIARRWNDPAFPAAFPHFGTERYWEREVSDLEAQLRVIQESA
jgi:Ser/Thr protein kinase RdoA (MazF antagonist)